MMRRIESSRQAAQRRPVATAATLFALACLARPLLGTQAKAQASTPYTANYVWDVSRRLSLVIQPDPGTGIRVATHYIYDLDSQLVEVDKGTTTQSNGSDFIALEKTLNTYDAVGNLITAAVDNGTATPALSITQTDYDADNRPTCTAVRQNQAVFSSLPASACTQSTAGSNGPDLITQKVYDAAGQVTQELHGVGTGLQQTYATYTFSLNGKMLTELDANTNLTSFIYDAFGRLATEQFPVTGRGANASDITNYESYAYDANGNLLSKRVRDGQVITYAYDALNRQTQKVAPGEATVATTYDLADHVLSALFTTTSTGVVYTYDLAGRQLTEATNGQALTYGYDAADNRKTITWPDAYVATYAYDAMNRLTSITESGTGSTLASFGYDSLSRRQSLTRLNGVTTTYTYDNKDRLATLAHSFANQSASSVSYGYGYTPGDQVQSQSLSNQTYQWAASVSAFQAAARTSDGLNRDSAIAAVGGGYDGRGNLTYDGSRTFTYDVENRLLSEAGPATASLTYDPYGRLRQTVINSTTTQLLYSGSALVAEYDGSGNLLQRYVHGSGVDEPLVWYQGTGTANKSWLIEDRHGSVIAVANSAGVVSETDTYGPYGEPSSWGGSRFRYTGQISLGALNLYHYKARVYDPNMGRFLQTDPVGYKDNLDLYEYVQNDPMDGTDPTGMTDVAADCAGKSTCGETVNQTVNIVHQNGGKTVVDSTISVSMNFSKTTGSDGKASWSVSSSVSNVSGKAFSNSQLATMGKSLGAMQSAAIGKGFGATTTQMVTSIGLAETHLGTYSAPGAPAFKSGAINPMQLSGGRANMNLEHNVQGAMEVVKWAGRPSNYNPTSTYGRYSDGSPATMANWNGTYGSLSEGTSP